ncbi:hypothetical protein G4B88_030808 [Cannabis sativa]|nr:hypothetical protein G4B88_030808 [Cannabis sativa]
MCSHCGGNNLGVENPKENFTFCVEGLPEILPTRNGLFRRNIASSTSCQLCGFGGESNAHAIFWCPVAQGIWNLMEFSFLHEVKEEIDFKNVLLYASEVVDEKLLQNSLSVRGQYGLKGIRLLMVNK